jgi:hypothetical protein
VNLQKRASRAKRKAKANRLERWNGVPVTLSKHKVLRQSTNVAAQMPRTAAPKFTMEATGRFLRTVVIEAGQRVSRMIPLLKRVKVEEPS